MCYGLLFCQKTTNDKVCGLKTIKNTPRDLRSGAVIVITFLFRNVLLKTEIIFTSYLQLFSPQGSKSCINIPEISQCQLKAPKDNDNKDITIHLGRGVFGSCKKMYYKEYQ